MTPLKSTLWAVWSLVLGFFVNGVISYFLQEPTILSISKPIAIDGRFVSVVSIQNYSSDYLKEFGVEVPSAMSFSTVAADMPVKIEEVPVSAQAQTKLLKVSNVLPQKISNIFIFSNNLSDAEMVKVANPSSINADILDDKLESKVRRAVKESIFVTIPSACLIFIFLCLMRKEIEQDKLQRESDIKPIREAHNKLTEQMDNAKKESAAIKRLMIRQRALLYGRISDYSKELNFWRNTIKHVLMDGGIAEKNVDALINTVTRSLETYGTLNSPLPESIIVAKEWLEAKYEDDHKNT